MQPINGDDIDKAADGATKLIKASERNRWAIVLLLSFAANIVQFIHAEKKDAIVLKMQQDNAQKAQDALYNIYMTKKELDTVKNKINEKDTQ